MEQNLKLSIIIPVYNIKKYIGRCIESIISNIKETEYEILLVNDASTDGSDDVCKEYLSENMFLLENKNKGVSGARNLGTSKAKGEYLLFVDGDDFVDKNLETAIKEVLENNADISCFGVIGDNLEEEKQILEFTNNKLWTKEDGFLTETLKVKKLNNCFKFFRRDFIMTNELTFPPYVTAEDMQFVIKSFAKAESIYFSKTSFYHYFINREGSAMTSVSLKKCNDAICSCYDTINYINELTVSDSIKTSLLKYVSKTAYFTLKFYKRLKKEDKPQFINCVKSHKIVLKYPSNCSTKSIKFLLAIFGYKFVLNIIGMVKK